MDMQITSHILSSSPTSDSQVKRLHVEVLESAKHPNPPVVLVGNKSDTDDFNVESFKGRDLSHSWSCGFIESSAKTGEGINTVFKELLKQANIQYKLSPALRKRRMSLPSGSHASYYSQYIIESNLRKICILITLFAAPVQILVEKGKWELRHWNIN